MSSTDEPIFNSSSAVKPENGKIRDSEEERAMKVKSLLETPYWEVGSLQNSEHTLNFPHFFWFHRILLCFFKGVERIE